MKANACCFTGHRKLPQDRIERIIMRLNDEVERLILSGVTDFISGGALGFDQIAASLIIAKKNAGYDIRLIFALPCRNQEEHWDDRQKCLYHDLLNEADEIRYVSEEYTADCMKKRNYHMVEQSSYCICAFLYARSGTGQDVRHAHKKGVFVINVAE